MRIHPKGGRMSRWTVELGSASVRLECAGALNGCYC